MIEIANNNSRLNEAKSEFLALLSHEFRTPLMSLLTGEMKLNPAEMDLRTITKHVNVLLSTKSAEDKYDEHTEFRCQLLRFTARKRT